MNPPYIPGRGYNFRVFIQNSTAVERGMGYGDTILRITGDHCIVFNIDFATVCQQ